MKPDFVTMFTRTTGFTMTWPDGKAVKDFHPVTKTPTCPLVAVTPGALPVAFGGETARPTMVPLCALEVDFVMAVHRLLIPWKPISAPAPGCPLTKTGDTPAARLTYLLLKRAQRPGASIASIVEISRSVERLVCAAESFEASSRSTKKHRAFYTAAAVILADAPGMKPAHLWAAVDSCLPKGADSPGKDACRQWLARYPYRLPAK